MRVIILRSFTVDYRQRNLPEVWSDEMYRTPYLALPMRLTTEYLYVYCRDKVWHISIWNMFRTEGQTHAADLAEEDEIEEV